MHLKVLDSFPDKYCTVHTVVEYLLATLFRALSRSDVVHIVQAKSNVSTSFLLHLGYLGANVTEVSQHHLFDIAEADASSESTLPFLPLDVNIKRGEAF